MTDVIVYVTHSPDNKEGAGVTGISWNVDQKDLLNQKVMTSPIPLPVTVTPLTRGNFKARVSHVPTAEDFADHVSPEDRYTRVKTFSFAVLHDSQRLPDTSFYSINDLHEGREDKEIHDDEIEEDANYIGYHAGGPVVVSNNRDWFSMNCDEVMLLWELFSSVYKWSRGIVDYKAFVETYKQQDLVVRAQ
jgi:hypothetical protein